MKVYLDDIQELENLTIVLYSSRIEEEQVAFNLFTDQELEQIKEQMAREFYNKLLEKLEPHQIRGEPATISLGLIYAYSKNILEHFLGEYLIMSKQ